MLLIRHKQLQANIVEEVIPYVDKNFRTKPERAFRAIEGFSMGGYGATMLGAKHPDLFGAIVEYSGASGRTCTLVRNMKCLTTTLKTSSRYRFGSFQRRMLANWRRSSISSLSGIKIRNTRIMFDSTNSCRR